MGKIISFYVVKGGVGKTTSCITFANILSLAGKKVLVVDDDPQGNATMMLNQYGVHNLDIHDLYMNKKLNKDNIHDYIYSTGYPKIDVIPSSSKHINTLMDVMHDMGRMQQLILKKALSLVRDEYDYILIDNNFNADLLSTNSLCAADYVLSPVNSEGFSYQGVNLLLDQISMVKEEFNPDLALLGVFVVRANSRTNLFKQLIGHYQEEIPDVFLDYFVRDDNSVNESNHKFVPLLYYKMRTRAGSDYVELIHSLGFLSDSEFEELMEMHGVK